MNPAPPALPSQTLGAGAPAFDEPWQAKGFALALALHQRGLFTWPEWAEALALQIAAAQARGDVDHARSYYRQWVAALESLVSSKGASSAAELERCQRAWDHAAERTRHGAPIELTDADFSPGSAR